MGWRNRFVYSVPKIPSSYSQLLSLAWDQDLGPKERMSFGKWKVEGSEKKEESKGIKWGGGRARMERERGQQGRREVSRQ